MGKKEDTSALAKILAAYQSVKDGERKLKDTRGEYLNDSKAAQDEVDAAIGEAKTAMGTDDAPGKLETVVTCWEAYKTTKADGAESVKTAKGALEEAQEAFETAVAAAKQVELVL